MAFRLIFDFSRDAALIGIREQDEVAPGEDDVGGNARALRADGAFGDLHDNLAAGRIDAGDVFLGDFWFVAPAVAAGGALDDFDATVKAAGDDVPVMEERILLEA